MDTFSEEESLFDHVTCNISTTADEVTIPGALALDLIEQISLLADSVHIILHVCIDDMEGKTSQILFPIAVNGILTIFSSMVPIRALVVEAPVLLLRQNWVVGFFFFKMWRILVLLNYMTVLVDESWRTICYINGLHLEEFYVLLPPDNQCA